MVTNHSESGGSEANGTSEQGSDSQAPTDCPSTDSEGRARVVYLHLAEDARDRTLSTWRTSTLEPQVVELGYGQYGWADVEPGPQGFCARFSGQEPPTKQKLGWNTGLGNLTPGLLSFVVAHRIHAASDAVTTRSERAIAAEPTAGRSTLPDHGGVARHLYNLDL